LPSSLSCSCRGRARAGETAVPGRAGHYPPGQGTFKLKLDKWKFNKDMDSRCIDPNFETKGWKSTGLGYMWPEFKSVWFRVVYKMPETVAGKPVKGSKVISTLPGGNRQLYVNGKFEQYFRRTAARRCSPLPRAGRGICHCHGRRQHKENRHLLRRVRHLFRAR